MTLRQDLKHALIYADVFDSERFRYFLLQKEMTDAEQREARGRLVKYDLPKRIPNRKPRIFVKK